MKAMNSKNNETGLLRIFFLLLRKCWQVRRRQWIVSLIEIFIPVSFICYSSLSYGKMLSEKYEYVENDTHYESRSLEQLIDQMENKSFTIIYTPSNSFTDKLINKVVGCLKNHVDSRGFDSKSKLIIYALMMSNRIKKVAPIIFDESTDESTKYLHYTILKKESMRKYNDRWLHNVTDYYTRRYRIQVEIQVQFCLDWSFIQMKSNETRIEIPRVSIQQYPYPSHTRPKKNRCVSLIDSFIILLCVFTVLQIVEASKVTGEKNAGTNILMSMNGIPNSLNLLSWMLSGSIFLSIICVISVGLLHFTGIFCSSNPVILFIVLIAHLTHAVTFTIHLSAHVSKTFRLTYTLIVLELLIIWRRSDFLEVINHRIIPFLGMIFPSILFDQILDEMDAFERMGIGIQWNNFFDSANPLTKFEGTVGMIVILSAIGTILHFWLAIYVNNIKPGKFGIKRHPLFFFMNKKKARSTMEISPLDVENGKYFEVTPTRVQTATIQIRNLNKVYDSCFFYKEKVHALRDISIDFYKGQITSILGHNGAGKSTLMSILSGLTKPTDGLILVGSKSLEDNASEILKDIGFYAQHDIYFPSLTVKEQLEFFAMVKGGRKSMFTIKSNVASLILKLRLFDVKDCLPSKLTEDQKRKLCLGIAFAADPRTLILDEPTSRLDYENKRIVWDILLEMRGRKTILISTHDMEEADILGDRIAIMHEGRFKSYGTSVYPKKSIAGQSNIVVTLSVERWCDPDGIRHQIHGKAQIIEKLDKKMVVDVPISATLLESIGNLEKNKKEFAVTDIELSHVGLEQVFLKVAEDSYNPQQQEEAIIRNKVKRQEIKIQSQSFKALLVTNFQYALKNVTTLVTQLFAIIVGLLLISNQNRIHLAGWENKLIDGVQIIDMQLGVYDKPYTLYMSYDENIGNQYRLLSQSFGARSIGISSANLDTALLQSAKKDRIRYSNNLVAAAEFNKSANGSLIANAFYSGTISYSLPISVNLVSNVMIRSILGDDLSIATSTENLLDPYFLFDLNMWKWVEDYKTSFAFVIPIYYAIAMFAARPSCESASGFKHLQRMTGVSGFTYWADIFLSDLVQYLFLVVLLVTGAMCIDRTFDLPFYGITEIGIMILLLVLLAVNVLPIIYIFSFIKTKNNFALKCFTLIPIALVVGEYATINWQDSTANDVYFMIRLVCHALPYISFFRAQMRFHTTGMQNAVCKGLPNDFFQLQCGHAVGLCCEIHCQDRSCLKLLEYFSEDDIDSLKICVMSLCVMPIIYLAILAVLESKIYRKVIVKCPTQMVKKSCNDERLQLEESIIHNKIQTLRKNRSNRTVGNGLEAPPSRELFLAYELRKHYGKVKAVDDISLRVNRSECFGIFGANGSGRSTIFKMLTGIETPDHGVMFLEGMHFKNHERNFLSQIGYCPQHDTTLKHLNSYDHLRLFARLRGVPEGKVEEEVLAWIGRLSEHDIATTCGLSTYFDVSFFWPTDLTAYASQPSGTLSSGNRQRLNLAMALVASPKFVLLDEPTTHMDPGARRSFWRTVESCKSAGQTFLVASHSMDECEVLCEKMGIMLDCKLLCLGTPDELKKRFGAGYDVQIRISPRRTKSQVDRIKKDMRLLLQCVLTNENMGFLMYHVMGTGTSWSKIYGVMNKIKSKYDCVDDFLVIVRLSHQSADE